MAGIDAFTSMCLHMDGTDASTTFTDSAITALTITANGSAQIDTAQSVFGGASGLFPLSGYLTTTDTAALDFGTGDYTIDFRVRFSTIGVSQRLFGIGTYNSSGICGIFSAAVLYFYINSGTPSFGTAWVAAINTWYHIAIIRTGSTVRVFIDGAQLGLDLSDSTSMATTDGVFVSAWNIATGDGLDSGWFDEFRISKGIARWTTTFTPDAQAYSVDSANIMKMCLMGIG